MVERLIEKGESRDSIDFLRYQVESWFKNQKENTYPTIPVPYLSDNHKS